MAPTTEHLRRCRDTHPPGYDRVRLYPAAELVDVEVETGPFDMMTRAGFLHDEGLTNTAAFPYLGFILVSGIKPTSGE